MSERRAYIDRGIGEVRGVVTLDARPERLLIRRHDDDPRLQRGARLIARVATIEPALMSAFLELGDGAQCIMPFRPDSKPVRGSVLEVEIRSEPRRGKLAVARGIGPAEGGPRLLAPGPDVETLLKSLVRDGQLVTGCNARDVADLAEAEALDVVHALPGGGTIAIEPTRALTAVDVDLGERKGSDAKRVTRQTNIAALREAARLLRLKNLGGIVVIDLAGRGHDGNALMAAARAAFGPDNPGVAIGPVGRFGTMEISLPRRARPVSEILCGDGCSLADRSIAQRLIRRIQAEAEARPGARLMAKCAPSVARAARPLAEMLAEKIGARFTIHEDSARARESSEVAEA